MTTLVIYHAHCSDGTMAAACVVDALKRAGTTYELHEGKYGDPAPACAGRRVIVVDFSYPRDELLRMEAEATELVVLDHHKTAAADLAGLPFAHFDMERSGAGMAWDFFNPKLPRPGIVDAIEDRDLWRFALPHTREIFAAYDFDMARLPDAATKVEASVLMLQADAEDLAAMRNEGTLLTEQFAGIIANICEQSYRIELLGEAFMCVNAPGKFASEGGNYLVEKFGLPACVWYTDGTELKLSLRSRDDLTDVSAIAKAFGGGGHRNAAGFRAGLRFMDEVGMAHVDEETGHELEAAGMAGVAVWDAADGEKPPTGA